MHDTVKYAFKHFLQKKVKERNIVYFFPTFQISTEKYLKRVDYFNWGMFEGMANLDLHFTHLPRKS